MLILNLLKNTNQNYLCNIKTNNMSDKYLQRGVSAAKEEVHDAIKNLDKGLFPQAFCKIHPDYLAGDKDFVNVMSSDGSGTKSIIAYLYWKETGDASVWRGIAQDVIVMNLDDLLCVGATGPFVYNSIINRNKHKIPGEVLKEIIEGTASFFEMLQKYEINCHFLGGETADLGDITQTMTTDGTMTTRMLQKNIINNGNIQAGQVIVGLASYGQAIYENEYNSGIGSNGLTSARHDLLSKKYATLYPESFDSNTNQNVLYCGKYSVTDQLPNLPLNIGKMLLSPTRTFSPVIKNILNNCGDKIRGLVHCTGGGQTKVLHYIQNVDIVKNNLLPISDFFQLIKNESNVSWQEMYKVYNCGTKFELYTDETTASEVIQIANSFGIDAQIIGYTSTQKESKPRVIIQNNGEEIVY